MPKRIVIADSDSLVSSLGVPCPKALLNRSQMSKLLEYMAFILDYLPAIQGIDADERDDKCK